MGNALIWLLGISVTVLAVAYTMIILAMLAAKRRMATPAAPRRGGVGDLVAAMRYRTQ